MYITWRLIQPIIKKNYSLIFYLASFPLFSYYSFEIIADRARPLRAGLGTDVPQQSALASLSIAQGHVNTLVRSLKRHVLLYIVFSKPEPPPYSSFLTDPNDYIYWFRKFHMYLLAWSVGLQMSVSEASCPCKNPAAKACSNRLCGSCFPGCPRHPR